MDGILGVQDGDSSLRPGTMRGDLTRAVLDPPLAMGVDAPRTVVPSPPTPSRRAILVLGDGTSAPLLADMLRRAGAVEVSVVESAHLLTDLDGCATLVADVDALDDPWALARHARARDLAVGLVFVGTGAEAFEERALALGVAEILDWDEIDGGGLLRACRRAAWRARDRARLHRLARSDPGTELARPLLLRDRLATALAAARRRDTLCACFHLLLGRAERPPHAGEGLAGRLDRLAALLVRRLRRADTVARLGPDEIGVLVEDLRQPEDAVTVALKLDAAARDAGFVAGFDLFGGVALGPRDRPEAEALLAGALEAAHAARREGRGFAFADPTFDRRARTLLEAGAALADDLAAGRLTLVFQPQLALHPGPVGFEAGFSWHHGRFGRLEGDALAAFAACVGLADRLTHALLARTMAQGAAWHAAGLDGFLLAVPLPARRSLTHLDLEGQLEALWAEYRPPPRSLELELEEDHLLQALDDPSGLRGLTDGRVRLAVNGFGRGPTALRLLWELPLDTVRIAASTLEVAAGRNEAPAFELVRMAKAHGRRTVVDLEDMDLLPALRRSGCDAVQWVVERSALTVEEARRWLVRHRPSAAGR